MNYNQNTVSSSSYFIYNPSNNNLDNSKVKNNEIKREFKNNNPEKKQFTFQNQQSFTIKNNKNQNEKNINPFIQRQTMNLQIEKNPKEEINNKKKPNNRILYNKNDINTPNNNNFYENKTISNNKNNNIYENKNIYAKNIDRNNHIIYNSNIESNLEENEINTSKNFPKENPINNNNQFYLSNNEFLSTHYNNYNNNNIFSSYFTKERMDILYLILGSLLFIGFNVIIFYKFINNESFKNNFNSFINSLNPIIFIKDFIIPNLLISFRKFIWDYSYITFPVILITIFISIQKRNHKIIKTSNLILQDIIKRLKKNSSNNDNNNNILNGISEDQIIHDYSILLNISIEQFNNIYMPILIRMRRNNPYLKIYEDYINGKNKKIWQWRP